MIPEGLAFDKRTGLIYVGSTHKRKIIQIDSLGRIKDFIPPEMDAIWSRQNCFILSDQSFPLNKPGYNLFQELMANFNIRLPGIYDAKTDCSMTLKRNRNTFSGYIFYGKTSEKSFYTMPLFVENS